MSYSKKEIIQQLENCKLPSQLYKLPCINYRGKSKNLRLFYTEIISEWILENLGIFAKIQTITRESNYHSNSRNGLINTKSNRREEQLAKQIFNQGCFSSIGKILDYQTPLKNKQTDRIGKIDLLAYSKSQKTLHLLELKDSNSTETLLRCILEIYTYFCTVDKQKILSDFLLPPDTKISCASVIFPNSKPYLDWISTDQIFTKQLLKQLDIELFTLSTSPNKYLLNKES